MDKNFEQQYHHVEDFHWWFRARKDIIANLLADVDEDAAILDVGCSRGVLIQFLKSRGFNNVYGIDISETAVSLCHQNHIDNTFRMDAKKLEWKDKEFDVVIASDVLEHINEDKTALTEWNRVLKKDGILIIFVPAFQFLWCQYDTVNYHYRRYTKSNLVKILKDSNFEICRSSYWNSLLFFPIAFVRFIQKKIPYGTEKKMTENYLKPSFNNLFLFLLKFENWLLRRIDFP